MGLHLRSQEVQVAFAVSTSVATPPVVPRYSSEGNMAIDAAQSVQEAVSPAVAPVS